METEVTKVEREKRVHVLQPLKLPYNNLWVHAIIIHILFKSKYTCVHLHMCLNSCMCANSRFTTLPFYKAFISLWTVRGSSLTLLGYKTPGAIDAGFTGLTQWHHCTNTVALVAWHRLHKPQEWPLYTVHYVCPGCTCVLSDSNLRMGIVTEVSCMWQRSTVLHCSQRIQCTHTQSTC